MSQRTRKTLVLVITLGVVVVIDQLTKKWALVSLTESGLDSSPGFLSFSLVKNSGLAFGLPLFYTQTFFVIVIVVILFFLLRCYWQKIWVKKGDIITLAIGLILGGAVGNLLDRVNFGSIVDFIKIYSWPVFNIADVAIVVGTVILLVYLLRRDLGNKKTGAAPAEKPDKSEAL